MNDKLNTMESNSQLTTHNSSLDNAHNSQFKQTEVGVIPEDWEVKIFKDICWVNQGLQIAIEERLKHPIRGSKKYITIQFLNNAKDVEYIDSHNESVCCKNDDVLMTRTGNTGIVITGVNGVFHNNFFKINYNREIINKSYLVYFLKQPKIQKLILSKAGTSTIPDLNHDAFYSLPFITPPTKAEQTAIATALSDMDALIEAMEKLIAKKRNIKQGAMQVLLSPTAPTQIMNDELSMVNEKENSQFTTHNSSLLKEGWEVKTVAEIGKPYGGLSGKAKKDFENGTKHYIPFMNVMSNPIIDTSYFDYVRIENSETQNKAQKGDLFFNTSSETPEEVGMCSILLDDIEELYLNSFCFGFRFHKGTKDDGLYLSYFFRSSYGRKKLFLLAQGTTRYNLSKNNFLKLELELPKPEEQTRIAQILSDMDDEIEKLETQLSKYKMIKTGMMQELLTGKKRLI